MGGSGNPLQPALTGVPPVLEVETLFKSRATTFLVSFCKGGGELAKGVGVGQKRQTIRNGDVLGKKASKPFSGGRRGVP